MNRIDHLHTLYGLLDRIARNTGGMKSLPDAMRQYASQRGVYFFIEDGQIRRQTGAGPRVVRVGTHGLKVGSRSTMGGRLRQHFGTKSGIGNHRGSIFRLLIGDALIRSQQAPDCLSWGCKSRDKLSEEAIERLVSQYLYQTRVICLTINDPPGPDSLRGSIERNAIALLSNHDKEAIDPPSANWLGHHSSRPRVRSSGLWNQSHVGEEYDPAFLLDLDEIVRSSEKAQTGTEKAV